MPDSNDDDNTVTLWPLPDQRHLYMIVAGILLGVLLSPAVLGRAAPAAYDTLFIGSGDTAELDTARQQLDDYNNDEATRDAAVQDVLDQYETLNAIGDPGASVMVARDEQVARLTNAFAEQKQRLDDAVITAEFPVEQRRAEHAQKLAGLATTLLLVLVVVFAVESILSPPSGERRGRIVLPPTLGRLVTIRYALIAGWVLLMLAQPATLRQTNLVVGIVLVAVVLVVGLVPLGKRT